MAAKATSCGRNLFLDSDLKICNETRNWFKNFAKFMKNVATRSLNLT